MVTAMTGLTIATVTARTVTVATATGSATPMIAREEFAGELLLLLPAGPVLILITNLGVVMGFAMITAVKRLTLAATVIAGAIAFLPAGPVLNVITIPGAVMIIVIQAAGKLPIPGAIVTVAEIAL